MQDPEVIARNVAAQREWYGEPLGDRVRRLVVAFDVSQAQLAGVLGVSPPMLSQLMSGRRAKIGNPAVLARMVLLERQVLTPAVASGDPAAMRAALEQVRQSRPTVGRDTVPAEPAGAEVLLPVLLSLAAPAELAAAATVLREQFPQLSALLLRAAQAPSPEPDHAPDTSAQGGALPAAQR